MSETPSEITSVISKSPSTEKSFLRAALFLLALLALLFFLWPLYRTHFNTPLDDNEGWNAFHADAAYGRGALYPSQDKLVTNNYPPLSFYVVGALGKLLGDNIIAGRILSLVAVLAIALAIAKITLNLGGNRIGAFAGGGIFVATICRYFGDYVGMDDPQLLAQAIMAWAAVGFTQAMKQNQENWGAYFLPILGMCLAGFFKHNIIAIPVASMLWLLSYKRRAFFLCLALSILTCFLGLALCRITYGRDFLLNFLSPRTFSWENGLSGIPYLRFVAVPLTATCILGWCLKNDQKIQFCIYLTGTAILSLLIESCGSGVDINAAFDLLIAVSVGAALALSQPTLTPNKKTLGIVLTCIGLWPSPSTDAIQFLENPIKVTKNWQQLEKETQVEIKECRRIKGDVYTDTFVLYRSGKNFVVDTFNMEERKHAGKIPKDIISQKVETGKLSVPYPIQ